jgi:hypothetical protein
LVLVLDGAVHFAIVCIELINAAIKIIVRVIIVIISVTIAMGNGTWQFSALQ